MCVLRHLVLSDSLRPHRLQPTRLLCPWNSPGKDTGAGSHFLLQETFSTQGWNLRLLHFLCWQADSLPLHHLGSLQERCSKVANQRELYILKERCRRYREDKDAAYKFEAYCRLMESTVMIIEQGNRNWNQN